MNHSVSDFIIRLKNASMARRPEFVAPFSRVNKDIGQVLQQEGYLNGVKEEQAGNKRVLKVQLKYERRQPVFSDIKVVSKPSLRVYKGTRGIKDIHIRGRHTVVISTSEGIMTGAAAQKKGVGGEVLFEIW